jgi:hypothetical protein
MENVLVIGVGGTGIKTLLHIKKQLLDQNPEGKLPENVQLLGIDTRVTQEKIKGVADISAARARQRNLGYDGQVVLTNQEYVFVGGDVEDWICGNPSKGEPGWGRDHYGASWLDRSYFCNHPDCNKLLNITDGAGMYRQVGRLAIFNALRMGTASHLYASMQAKINALGPKINVIICGSLAGGTGAAMFIDLVHLAKKMAADSGKSADGYAMLALPGAFEHTSQVTVNDAMKARSVAALRELQRFLTVHSKDIGFELRLNEGSHPVLTSRTEGAVFSIVYLFDERGQENKAVAPRNPLDVDIQYGVTPTMATWILALVDPQAGSSFAAEFANRAAEIGSKATDGLIPAVTASVGSYSVVLPVAAIIENWTLRLAQQVIEELAPCLDEEGTLDPRRKYLADQTEGKKAAINAWTNHPAPVARDVGRLQQGFTPGKPNPGLISLLCERTIGDWSDILLRPQATQAQLDAFDEMDDQVNYFYNTNAGFLRDPLKGALVQLESIKNHAGNVRAAADEIVRTCDHEENQLFSVWQMRVNERVNLQFNLYRTEILDLVRKTLNGELAQKPTNALVNKAGKLGWLLQYVKTRTRHLDYVRLVLEEAIHIKQMEILSVEESLDSAAGAGLVKEMQNSAMKQKVYLSARQNLFAYRKWRMFCEAELELVKQLHRYTEALEKNLNEYGGMLQAKLFSLSADLKRREIDIQHTRESGKALSRVREVINDPAWEDEKYAEYNTPDQDGLKPIEYILDDLTWEVGEITLHPGSDAAFEIPRLALKVKGFNLASFGTLQHNAIELADRHQTDQEKTSLAAANTQRLMTRCRAAFDRVWDSLTVIDYLSEVWNKDEPYSPIDFAKYLYEHCDVLLDYPVAGNHRRLTYLLTPQVKNNSQWRQMVFNHLESLLKATHNNHGELDHSDTTTLTFITTIDFVDIETIRAYTEGLQAYIKLPPQTAGGVTLSRSLAHIYASEQNASRFDQKDHGSVHLVRQRVSAVLENEERLQLFIQSLALGLLRDEAIVSRDGTGTIGRAKEVVIDPYPGELDEFDDPVLEPHIWMLNEPEDYPTDYVPYLVAAETFCLRMYDFSQIGKPIYRLHERLVNVTKERIDRLVEDYLPVWERGEGDPSGITAASEPKGRLREAKLRTAARRMVYKDLAKTLQAYQSPNSDHKCQVIRRDEEEFIRIMIEYLKIWIKQAR